MKNANLPFDRLMALSEVEGLRYSHSSSLRPAAACGTHSSARRRMKIVGCLASCRF
jgi:hypothetical protein